MWQHFAEKTSSLWINANPMFGAEVFHKYVRKSVHAFEDFKVQGGGVEPMTFSINLSSTTNKNCGLKARRIHTQNVYKSTSQIPQAMESRVFFFFLFKHALTLTSST